ncbi:gliding motility protein GldC [Cytophagaceae bacterium ABcell3]|nr:gliding motility protein GldC [Cytophagaceae bacterium ABcell3]
MKKSEIKFEIDLDEKNIPEKIYWDATDSPSGKLTETKALSVSLWDPKQKNTMRIDLWAKDMTVDEMKQFCIETLGGMADTIKNSTGDEVMSDEIKSLCTKLVKHVQEESKK